MNKVLRRISNVVAISVASIGAANASLVTMTDVYKESAPIYLAPDNSSVEFTRSFKFDWATDTIKSARLEFFFRDDGNDGAEKADIYLDGKLIAEKFEANKNFIYTFQAPFTEFADGSLTGKVLDIKVGNANASAGDFFFDKAELTVTLERVQANAPLASAAPSLAVNNVPEPGSMVLIGLGLAGLAATRRRRAK